MFPQDYCPDVLPRGHSGKESAASAGEAGDTGLTLGQEEPPEEEMATYSSILAWEIPWTEELVGYSP